MTFPAISIGFTQSDKNVHMGVLTATVVIPNGICIWDFLSVWAQAADDLRWHLLSDL